METPGNLIKYHQIARPENRVSLSLENVAISIVLAGLAVSV